MMNKRAFFVILFIVFTPYILKAEPEMAVRIAVLPFEVFSIAKKPVWGNEVAVKLSKRLAINPYIVTPDFQSVQSVLSKDEYAILDEERLKDIAKLLEANFLLYGSITKIKDKKSIDVQLYNNFPLESRFKTFAEGTELDSLIEETADRIEQELMEKAEFIPPSQRPKVTIKHKAEEDDIIDFEEEFAEGFGFEEAKGRRPDKEAEMIVTEPATAGEPVAEDENFTKSSDPQKQETVSDEEDAKPVRKKDIDLFKSDRPFNINADSMEYDNRQGRAAFEGNVVARQGDIVIFADKMQAHRYSDQDGFKQVSATGNVKVVQGDMVATGQEIVFYDDKQMIVATGSPRVWQGDNVIQGKKIHLYLKQDRYFVEGSPQDRVRATIYPKEKKP